MCSGRSFPPLPLPLATGVEEGIEDGAGFNDDDARWSRSTPRSARALGEGAPRGVLVAEVEADPAFPGPLRSIGEALCDVIEGSICRDVGGRGADGSTYTGQSVPGNPGGKTRERITYPCLHILHYNSDGVPSNSFDLLSQP